MVEPTDLRPLFGTHIYTRGVVLRGKLTIPQWRKFIKTCIELIGMTPFGEAAVWEYPEPKGEGPQGFVIVQPLTESYLALDVWPVHDCAYLFITSCKRFALSRVTEAALLSNLDVENMSAPITLRLE